MARQRGRAPKGERLRAAIPHDHWKTTTFVAGLRLTGMVAPMVLDRSINRDAFQAYVDQVLVQELSPGDVVVMDNLSSHKGAQIRQAIEAAGASLLYLPPTVPTSTRSRTLSRSSKPCSERPPNEPSTASGTPSVASATSSHLANVPTSSELLDTTPPDRKML